MSVSKIDKEYKKLFETKNNREIRFVTDKQTDIKDKNNISPLYTGGDIMM